MATVDGETTVWSAKQPGNIGSKGAHEGISMSHEMT